MSLVLNGDPGCLDNRFFDLVCGVRQGGVLSPYLLAIYIDNTVRKVSDSRIASFLKGICISIGYYYMLTTFYW